MPHPYMPDPRNRLMTSGTDRIGGGSSEFSVVPNNPQTRVLVIALSIPYVVLWTCVLVSFAVGAFGQQDALFMALILAVVGGTILWHIRQYGRGSAVMNSSELVVRTRGATHSYNWSDVADVLLTSFVERGPSGRLWARLLLWPERKPFVELRLKRALRAGLWPGRYGTRLKGIALIGGDRVALFVHEPESFVRSAKSHVRVSGD